MTMRMMLAVGCLLALVLAGPVSAEDFTGAEEQEETLDCHYDGSAYPETQEAPDEGECVDPETQPTYQGLVWDNDVQCAEGGTDAQGLQVYTYGDASPAGGVGICNDGGSEAPIQGRAAATGSSGDGTVTVYADGDKDNDEGAAQGYGRVDAGPGAGGATVTCGDASGKQDATSPSSGDGQDQCG